MHRIRSKLATLAVCLCVLAAAALVFPASAANSGNPWYQPYMDAFEQNGWLEGIAADKLQPDDSINRAQFASIVNRAAGLTEESGKIADYTDVPADSAYRADLAKALAAGYMSGTSTTKMSPDSPLTRQDAAVMLARLMNLPAAGDLCFDRKPAAIPHCAQYADCAAAYRHRCVRRWHPARKKILL